MKSQSYTFTLKIVNSGLSDIKFLYVIASDASGMKFLSEKEQYIGDIDSDDFDSVDYNVVVNADASNTISLPVTLTFMDATNKEFTETSSLVLKTYSLKEARELGLVDKPKVTAYVVIFILVVGYIVYRTIRKRKLKKKRR